jgi:hypothetical protein
MMAPRRWQLAATTSRELRLQGWAILPSPLTGSRDSSEPAATMDDRKRLRPQPPHVAVRAMANGFGAADGWWLALWRH